MESPIKEELSSEQVVDVIREVIGFLLDKKVRPKTITYSMVYVIAEFGFQYEKNHRGVLTGVLDSLVEASEEIAETQSAEENAIADFENTSTLKTLH